MPLRTPVLRRVSLFVLGFGVYAMLLVLMRQRMPAGLQAVPDDIHTYFGAVLGVFLVFRTNTAYDRWWEGRKLWGQLVNETRNLAIKVEACVQAAPAGKLELGHWLTVFPVALREHLRRRDFVLQELPGFEAALERPRHVPAWLAEQVYRRIEQWRQAEQLGGFELLFLDRHAAALMDICGGCERIRKTPIASSYLALIRQAVGLYLLTMPFGVLSSLGWWTVPVTAVVAWFMIGLEALAEAVEDPFGQDAEDLRLDELCDTIGRSVEDIMGPAAPGTGPNPAG